MRLFHHRRGRQFAHWHSRHAGHPGFEERRDRHHRRGGRLFDQGDLRWVILQMIADRPSHGYELIKSIEERAGGGYTPSPGVIYPTLTLLEDLGYIGPVDSAGQRKAFAITDEGRAALSANSASVQAIFERLDESARRTRSGGAPQIARAMQNLGMALSLRLQQDHSEGELGRIVRIIDEAARTIEAGQANPAA